MRRILLLSIIFLASFLVAFPQNEHQGPPCDNLPDNPHPCHCYDMEKGEKCDDPPGQDCGTDEETGEAYCAPVKRGPENSGHNKDGSANMGKKCQKYCAPEKCSCEDSCKS